MHVEKLKISWHESGGILLKLWFTISFSLGIKIVVLFANTWSFPLILFGVHA